MRKRFLFGALAALLAAAPLQAASQEPEKGASEGDFRRIAYEQRNMIDELQKERQQLIARIEDLQRQNAELNDALDRIRSEAGGGGEYRPT